MVRWTRKDLGDPLSCFLLPLRLLYLSPVPRGFREGGLLAEGPGARPAGSAQWHLGPARGTLQGEQGALNDSRDQRNPAQGRQWVLNREEEGY